MSLYGNPFVNRRPRRGWSILRANSINIDLAPDHPENATTIAGLAADCYYLPIEMYQYVVNTIEYQPYAGAMKGPLATLQTKAGNDWDTDSLLQQLLALAIPNPGSSISYVSGQIQVPIQQAEDYVGATDPGAAYDILNNAGQVPARVNDVNGQWVAMQFSHTWIQVQIGSVTAQMILRGSCETSVLDCRTCSHKSHSCP